MHSPSDAQNAQLVWVQFPDSPASLQASFLSSQTGVTVGATVGDEVVVELLDTGAGEGAWLRSGSTVPKGVGTPVSSAVGASVGLGAVVELDVEFVTGVGLKVKDELPTPVGTALPLNGVGAAVGAVVSFGATVGATVGSASPSSYTPSFTLEPICCKTPPSIFLIKASEKSVCKPEANSCVKSSEELIIDIVVVTRTHKSVSELPCAGQSVEQTKQV